jgi:alpha-D-xyloside xylohydrolase
MFTRFVFWHRALFRFVLFGLLTACLFPQVLSAQMPGQSYPLPHITASRAPDGFRATIDAETLHVSVCGDSIIHVLAGPHSPAASSPAQPWLLEPAQSCPGAPFQFAQTADAVTLTTASLELEFSLKWGNLTFRNSQHVPLLREGNAVPRTYEPAEVNGEKTYHVTDRFSPDATEAFYGLGQHQSGMFNYRGSTVELGQNNTDVAIPLLLSSKGYAILWNTASLTYADNRFPLEFHFTSLAGDAVDYYFLYGPEMDQIIHHYRTMTGHAPLFPKWAYGFFQSKDRYITQDEILGIAQRYRAQHIPLDAIVQDWFWWKAEGDPLFNSNFTDIPGELKTLHDKHVHAMLSVWGLFDPASKNFQEMTAKHFDVPNAHVYDATNPAARDFYWNNLAGPLFAQGWDAFWLDSAEPEEFWPHMGDAILRDKQLSIGNGARYTNIFPLLHTGGIHDHWRKTTDQKRVFLLTRSAFLGQQRNGATVWSGDVYSTFWGLQHQVAAGLNFALSGYPYWTTDIGGYWQPFDRPPNDPAYQELYTRWFQFGVFCPIFRTHGHRTQNELWIYDKVAPILINFDKLRYRLMPYIYSLAWQVTSQDYTIQRPLVMDWRADQNTWNIGDEFMFGPSILVSPVLKEGATQRSVYLPSSPAWYDFWSGERLQGGRDVQAEAPLDRIPLYVRAGSILPMGPEIEYADQSSDPIELRIYAGADADFALYEDEGDNYNYEKGTHAVIRIHWDDRGRTLTLKPREGTFPGMPQKHAFHLVLVRTDHGAGESPTAKPDAVLQYTGTEQLLTLP